MAAGTKTVSRTTKDNDRFIDTSVDQARSEVHRVSEETRLWGVGDVVTRAASHRAPAFRSQLEPLELERGRHRAANQGPFP